MRHGYFDHGDVPEPAIRFVLNGAIRSLQGHRRRLIALAALCVVPLLIALGMLTQSRATGAPDDTWQSGTDAPVRVQVVTLDWKFLFIYPDQGVASVNRLMLPAGQEVALELTSQTVMQSLFIPRLSDHAYAISGMATSLSLRADQVGIFRGSNSHYDGRRFASQTFTARVMPQAEFAAWVGGARDGGRTFDWVDYQRLSRPSVIDAPQVYGGVEDGLFAHIVRQFNPGWNGRSVPAAAFPQRLQVAQNGQRTAPPVPR